MSPSTNTLSGPTASKETLDIVPTITPTSPYPTKYDLNKIHTDIKRHHSDMKSTSYYILWHELPHLCYA